MKAFPVHRSFFLRHHYEYNQYIVIGLTRSNCIPRYNQHNMSRATKRRRSAKASATGVDFDEPLPYKHVPQLWPFQYRHSSIEFVRLLSDANTSSHSHVFDVIIESKHYALKIVRCHLEFHSRKLSYRHGRVQQRSSNSTTWQSTNSH